MSTTMIVILSIVGTLIVVGIIVLLILYKLGKDLWNCF